jgi:subtilisin family serine protease
MLMILCVLGAMYGYRAPLESKVDPRCYLDDQVRVWVYFTDKGVSVEQYDAAVQKVKRDMTDEARQRRVMRRGITDYGDLPLYEHYIYEIESYGGIHITSSRWLNAASFIVARDDIDVMAQFDFVHKVSRVTPFRAPREMEMAVEDTAIYGLTYRQSQMFGIDQVHDMGIFGSNVTVGFLDTGLRRTHTALNNINVSAEYDFLSGDQVFAENFPVTDNYGIYSDMVYHKTGSAPNTRYHLFLAGDTLKYGAPVRDILYTSSTDGMTWTAPLIKITDNYNNWTREIDVCGRDTMFLFYRDRYGLKYVVYTDTLLIQQPLVTGPWRREPSATMVGDTVYATFHNKDTLFISKGTISGFSSEMAIDSAQSNIKAPEIIGTDSQIGVFYHIFPEDTIYFKKTTLPGMTFTETFKTSGKDAQAIAAGDSIFLIWKDTSNDPLFRIAFTRSFDFGSQFEPAVYLSDEINAIGKISLAKHDDQVKITWESNGKVYFRNSSDNGATFTNVDSLGPYFTYLPTLGASDAGILSFHCVRGDSVTDGYSPTDPDYYFPRHGTEMLGLVGGYFSGRYIGAAPGAQFIVAKTENPDSLYEYPIEEDTYVAGLEWCETQGADIVSSSLGYSEWYSWPRDYDGRSSPASIAAHEATKRGMLVVTAAGNVSIPRLEIPGDGIDVITVGGIDTLYNRWEFSGYGPTYDGRIKPELVCLSAAPVVLNPDSSDSYLYSFGTSGATAIVTGICALLLEAHPNWDVDSVRHALFTTASFADAPTDSIGYGWPDAYAAITLSPIQADTMQGSGWLTPYPNPFILGEHNNIYVPFKLDRESAVEVKVYSMSGRLVDEQERPGLLLPGRYDERDPLNYNAAFIWDGRDLDGNEVASGIYYCVLNTRGAGNDVVKIAVVK